MFFESCCELYQWKKWSDIWRKDGGIVAAKVHPMKYKHNFEVGKIGWHQTTAKVI